MNVLEERSGVTKVITIHLEGGRNVWTTFHGNPSNSCGNIQLSETKNDNFLVALKEKSGIKHFVQL